MTLKVLQGSVCCRYRQSPPPILKAARRTVHQQRHIPSGFRANYPSSVQSQLKPVDAFYEDILSRRRHREPQIPPSPASASADPPTKSPPEDDRVARARIVFGSRLAGPAERRRELDAQSRQIAGVMVPPRPAEPDNCCMSGCVNCVWDRYRDEIEEWAAKSAEARAALQARDAGSSGDDEWSSRGQALEHRAISMDDDGGGSDANWVLPQSDVYADIPVGIREFMKTEKKLRDRKNTRR